MRSFRRDWLLPDVLRRLAREREPAQSFVSKHFVAILNTVASLLTFALGYALVTVHTQQLEVGKLELAKLRLVGEERRADVTSAQQLTTWVQGLHTSDAEAVRQAALALGMGGRRNVPYLVAPFLEDRPLNFDAITDGLRVSGLISHVDVCNTLCLAGRLARKETVGRISIALADLRCFAALDLINRLADTFNSEQAKKASENLKRTPVLAPKGTYSECDSSAH